MSPRDEEILITGASGFIGSRLVELLPGARLGKRPSFDLRDRSSVERAVEGIEVVVHLAAATEGDWDYFKAVTVEGTRSVFEAARAAGVRRIVHVSSMAVYDFSQGGLIDEGAALEARLELRNDYARAKAMAEGIARAEMERGGLEVCIVRPGIVHGPGGDPPLITTLKGVGPGVAILIGGGRRQLPLVEVDRMAEALALAAESSRTGIYNVVEPNPPTELEYVRGQHPRLVIIPVSVWPFLMLASPRPALTHGLRRVTAPVRFDGSRFQEDFGWQP